MTTFLFVQLCAAQLVYSVSIAIDSIMQKTSPDATATRPNTLLIATDH
jgi:hypothetical protein